MIQSMLTTIKAHLSVGTMQDIQEQDGVQVIATIMDIKDGHIGVGQVLMKMETMLDVMATGNVVIKQYALEDALGYDHSSIPSFKSYLFN